MGPSCPRGLTALVALATLLAPGIPVAADPVEGEYRVEFSGNESIWPLFDFEDCENDVIDGNDVDICLGMSFNRSGAGRVDGSGTFEFEVHGIGIDIVGTLAGTLRGAIKGSDQRGYRQTVGLKYSGNVSVAGVGGNLPATMGGRLTTSITPAGLVQTTGSLKVKVKRGTTTRATIETIRSQMPEGSGSWTLVLTITPSTDQKKLSGTAELILPDGSHFLPLTGSYRAKNDTAIIDARGRGAAKGITVNLRNARSSAGGIFESGTASYGAQGFVGRTVLTPVVAEEP